MMASATMGLGLASGLHCTVPPNANRINLSLTKRCQWGLKVGVTKNNVSLIGQASNVQVFVGESEPEDEIVRRFSRAVWEAGIISECRRRRYFESPQDAIKRKNQILRNRKKRLYSKGKSYRDEDERGENTIDEDDDDWAGILEGGFLEGGTLESGSLEGGFLEGGTLESGSLEGGTLERATLEVGMPF